MQDQHRTYAGGAAYNFAAPPAFMIPETFFDSDDVLSVENSPHKRITAVIDQFQGKEGNSFIQ